MTNNYMLGCCVKRLKCTRSFKVSHGASVWSVVVGCGPSVLWSAVVLLCCGRLWSYCVVVGCGPSMLWSAVVLVCCGWLWS